jgi:hypothetical protein
MITAVRLKPSVEIGDPMKIGRVTRVRSATGLRAHYAAVQARLNPPRAAAPLALPPPAPVRATAPAPVVASTAPPAHAAPPAGLQEPALPAPNAVIEQRIKAALRRMRWLKACWPVEARSTQIITAVEQCFQLTPGQLLSQRRTRDIAWPRQIAMTIARLTSRASLPEIGRRFGGRDHTTVLHAVRKWEAVVALAMAEVAAESTAPSSTGPEQQS